VRDHEYIVLGGRNRTLVGRYLTIISSVLSGLIVFLVLSSVDIAKGLNVNVNIPPTVMSLCSAGAVFTLLYMFFDKNIWKLTLAAKFLKIADLSGSWSCKGSTLDQEGKIIREWIGKITIVQSWDKIRVHLETSQSASDSITAAIIYDEVLGFRLLYNYQNSPRPGEPDLKGHTGCANFTFSKDLASATGDYYNGYGRPTYGRMEIQKI
jgi:hypothetical protein